MGFRDQILFVTFFWARPFSMVWAWEKDLEEMTEAKHKTADSKPLDRNKNWLYSV